MGGNPGLQDRGLDSTSALAVPPPQLRDTYGESFYLFLGGRELGRDSWRERERLDPRCAKDHKGR